MKRIVCLTLALLLAAPFCGALAENVFTTAYFTMTLPDGWEIDTEDLDKASSDGVEALGYFGDDGEVGLVAGAYLVFYDELKNVSLWNADEEELREYAEILMEELAEDNPEWIGTLSAGSVPFILIRGTDSDGEYLYADTVTNGYSVQFEVRVTDTDGEKTYPMTDEYVERFEEVLSTFVPVA